MAEPAQVQGLPKLLSYNAFLITASLFVGLSVLEGILDKNALTTIALLLLLAIGLSCPRRTFSSLAPEALPSVQVSPRSSLG